MSIPYLNFLSRHNSRTTGLLTQSPQGLRGTLLLCWLGLHLSCHRTRLGLDWSWMTGGHFPWKRGFFHESRTLPPPHPSSDEIFLSTLCNGACRCPGLVLSTGWTNSTTQGSAPWESVAGPPTAKSWMSEGFSQISPGDDFSGPLPESQHIMIFALGPSGGGHRTHWVRLIVWLGCSWDLRFTPNLIAPNKRYTLAEDFPFNRLLRRGWPVWPLFDSRTHLVESRGSCFCLPSASAASLPSPGASAVQFSWKAPKSSRLYSCWIPEQWECPPTRLLLHFLISFNGQWAVLLPDWEPVYIWPSGRVTAFYLCADRLLSSLQPLGKDPFNQMTCSSVSSCIKLVVTGQITQVPFQLHNPH